MHFIVTTLSITNKISSRYFFSFRYFLGTFSIVGLLCMDAVSRLHCCPAPVFTYFVLVFIYLLIYLTVVLLVHNFLYAVLNLLCLFCVGSSSLDLWLRYFSLQVLRCRGWLMICV